MNAKNKKKSKTFILGLAVAALLPLSLYFVMRMFSDGSLIIPGTYHYDEITPVSESDGTLSYDTVFHKISDIELINQLDREVNVNQQLRDKILVVSFFDTDCETCAEVTSLMNKVQKSFIKKNPDIVHFLSINESGLVKGDVNAIRAYSDQFKSDHDRWWFLTGESDEIASIIQHEFNIKPDSSINHEHINQVVLIDTFRNVRGYYNGLELAEGKKISDDIVILNMEKRKKKK